MAAWLSALTKPSVTNEAPNEKDFTRIDIAVIITFLFALFLGFGIRNNATTASRTVSLGEGLPTLQVPSNWIKGTSPDAIFSAINPRSPSIFNAEVVVTDRPLAVGEDIVMARTGLGLKRTQDLFRYRELEAEPVQVNGEQGILVTYAYVADPSREQGGNSPPVVVQAQDLIFPGAENQVLVVTIATDAATWEEEEAATHLIQDSLGMKIQEIQAMPDEIEEGGEQ